MKNNHLIVAAWASGGAVTDIKKDCRYCVKCRCITDGYTICKRCNTAKINS